MSDESEVLGGAQASTSEDGNLQDIHRLPDLHTAETLPPAKGDSDLRGQTPSRTGAIERSRRRVRR